MNIKQANNSFDKLDEKINKIFTIIPFDLIKEAAEEADYLKEGIEEQIEKLEDKKNLSEEQDTTLDRFQSSIETITNISSIMESLKDAVEEFNNIKSLIEDAKTTI